MRINTAVALRATGIFGDLARVGVAAADVVCAAIGQWDDVVRFVIVLAVLIASRVTGLPRPFDAALGSTLLLATVAMAADWYVTVSWIDWLIHCVTTGAVAAAVTMALVRIGMVPRPDPPLPDRQYATVALLVTAVGCTVGVLWEIYEWLATRVFGIPMVVGYTDTVADLAMDGLGALLAGVGVAWWVHRGHTTRRIPVAAL